MNALCDRQQPYTLFEIEPKILINEKTPLLPLICQTIASHPRSIRAVTNSSAVDCMNQEIERGYSWKFHFVNLAFQAFWLITPLCFLHTGFILYKVANPMTITPWATLLSLCSLAEVLFALYQRYLIRQARRYTTICALDHDNRVDATHALLHGDLRSNSNSNGPASQTLEVMIDEPLEEGWNEIAKLDDLSCPADEYQSVTKTKIDDPTRWAEALSFRERHRKWFMDAPWEDLRQDDILTWLASMISSLPLDQLLACPHHAKALWSTYAIIEKRSRTTFLPGRNPHIKIARLTLDPLNAVPRPLLLYTISGSANHVIRNYILPSWGFVHHVQGNIEYMLRIPPGWTPDMGRKEADAMPVMYLHGLGFGLIQNIRFLRPMLEQLPTHPILFPLAHHTGQSFLHKGYLKPWTRRQFVNDIQDICEKWGFISDASKAVAPGAGNMGGLSVISHSNGSVHHSWMIKDCPHLIRRHTFVDPIVFCLDEGFTCHAFCYRKPTTPFQLIMQNLVSTELGISFYIQRHFHWSDNYLLVDDHPDLLDPTKTQYFLGRQDVIIDAVRVREYLEGHGVRVGVNLTWDEDGGHSKALLGDSLLRVLNFAGRGVA